MRGARSVDTSPAMLLIRDRWKYLMNENSGIGTIFVLHNIMWDEYFMGR